MICQYNKLNAFKYEINSRLYNTNHYFAEKEIKNFENE
jgi:hypothetical protein